MLLLYFMFRSQTCDRQFTKLACSCFQVSFFLCESISDWSLRFADLQRIVAAHFETVSHFTADTSAIGENDVFNISILLRFMSILDWKPTTARNIAPVGRPVSVSPRPWEGALIASSFYAFAVQ